VLLAASLAVVVMVAVQWMLPSDRVFRSPTTLPDTRFDYTLSDFSARFQNPAGDVELILSGPSLVHDSATRIGTIADPRFELDPSGQHWSGQADQAELQREAEILSLRGNVRLARPLEEGLLEIRGERMHHHRSARTITADQPVDISTPSLQVQAGRALIRLDDDIVEFTNHVEATWHPAGTAQRLDGQRNQQPR
jgi:LPS export ABC transporter protein LptC